MDHDTCPSIRWQVFVFCGDNHDIAYFAGDDERPFWEEMKKVALMTRIKKHNLTSWLIILSFLFYTLSPSIAQAKPDESSMPSVIGQQNSQTSNQESNNGNIGKGQVKTKDNNQNNGNYNQGKNSPPGQGNANQGNNNKGNPGNNGADPNNRSGNNGKGNPNGNGNPDENASTNKDNSKGNDSLNADNPDKERRGAADTAGSIVDAIGRGTKDAAELLKSIPAKIVPTAIEAAEYLGAALAEKLEAIANFIQGIFGTTSPAVVSESTGATEG